jgi:hypothetical protein
VWAPHSRAFTLWPPDAHLTMRVRIARDCEAADGARERSRPACAALWVAYIHRAWDEGARACRAPLRVVRSSPPAQA